MTFSVLMSLYDKERPEYLKKCFESLLSQTLQASRVVLVCDGPINTSLNKIVDDYINILNIKVIRLPKNLGLGSALNRGLKECVTDYTIRMDTDDICLPERFSRQITAMQKYNVDILGSYACVIDENENQGAIRKNPISDLDIKKMLWANPIIHPSVIYRTQSIKAIGGYNENLRRRQDYELWFRAASEGLSFGNIPETLLLYRVDSNSNLKQTPKLAFEQGIIGFKGSRRVGIHFFKSIFCFVPFIRTLLPYRLQKSLASMMSKFDPRT